MMTDVILQLVKELPAVVFTAKYLLNEYAALDWAIIIYICMVVLCFVAAYVHCQWQCLCL